ncbi:MAG TPA: GNAT family N-acetyltransferase [Acidimicrobiales bacterium]|nr:GNAT family N-acetyltransferase [Acidimicrobiales bacterium]
MDELVVVARRVRETDNYPIFEPELGLAWFLTNPEPLDAWVAVGDGAILGHVALHPTATRGAMRMVAEHARSTEVAFVSRLLVDPMRRGQAIGARLLDHVREAARAAGRGLYLEAVDVPDGAAAMALYRATGWIELGRVRFDLLDDGTEEVVFAAPTY